MQIPYEMVKKLWAKYPNSILEGKGFSHLQCLTGFTGDGLRLILTPMNWYDYNGHIPPTKATHMPQIKAILEKAS